MLHTTLAGTAIALTLAGGIQHTEQVAISDGSGTQHQTSSDVSGAGQVISGNGRYVVFATAAPLVASDKNGVEDVYRRDTVDGRTQLISQRDGRTGNDSSFEPTISADGNRIAYTTMASNLLGQRDRNGHVLDVVVTRVSSGRTTLVSHSTAGFQREQNSFVPMISGNGKVVAFQSFASFDRRDDDNREDVYAHYLKSARTVQVSLLPGTGRDVRASVLVGDISDNGELVTFGQNNNLWVRNLPEKATVRFWQEPDSPPCQPFPAGSAGRPVLSGDGRYAAFSSCATDLPGEDGQVPDVYRIDLVNGEIVRAHPEGNSESYLPTLSRDGAYVGFGSTASNLIAGDDEGKADAFVVEVATGDVVRVSEDADGNGGDNHSATVGAVISDDGNAMAYTSYAGNLVEGDVFDYREVFVWRR